MNLLRDIVSKKTVVAVGCKDDLPIAYKWFEPSPIWSKPDNSHCSKNLM